MASMGTTSTPGPCKYLIIRARSDSELARSEDSIWFIGKVIPTRTAPVAAGLAGRLAPVAAGLAGTGASMGADSLCRPGLTACALAKWSPPTRTAERTGALILAFIVFLLTDVIAFRRMGCNDSAHYAQLRRNLDQTFSPDV